MNSPKILILHDETPFFKGVLEVLHQAEDLEVTSFVDTAAAAIDELSTMKPELLVADLDLAGLNTRDFLKKARAAHQDGKILVVSTKADAALAERVLNGGADGYILKDETADEVLLAIRDVLDGHLYVSEGILEAE